MNAIRQPAVAGSFYPAQRDVLERQLAQFLSEAANDAPTAAPPKVIIGPHAGYIYSGSVAARAYARLAVARGRIRRVVLIGPSHYVAFRGIAVDASEAWAMPGGTVAIDREAFDVLRGMPMVGVLDAAHDREHALEVHVPFLQQMLGEFRLVPIVTGDASPEAVAAVIEALWGGPETLIVISTDLSHYRDYAACQQIDQVTAEAIERFDPDVLTPTHACGSLATKGLLRAAKARGMAIERLDLRNSGDTAGPRDRVVGYGAWALYEPSPDNNEQARVEAIAPVLIDLARRSIAFGLDTGQPANVQTDPSLPSLLAAPGAAFVTLRRPDGSLRGCIGSVVATRPLIVDVVQHAFNAAFRDSRFPRLNWLELAGLSLSVSVLTPPTPMRFDDEADLLSQLQPGIDGLIIEDMGLRSLFLPSVWEELPDKHHFIAALKMKAGMRADHFS
ncbi:MAG TPA: AmmeMemoRadiSam system protein B, partial [Acetobacteraceae bacterium]|nr:AmmeMemoRadiSam system protein B [Acetobacteraceae bacterium]